MKFFIDTANINEVKEAASLGVLDGVTTNPSLVARRGRISGNCLKKPVQWSMGRSVPKLSPPIWME